MKKKIQALIVDDSAVVRQTLEGILNSDPEIDVMATAADPFFAMLPVPDGTGGRFSAFSPVGLLALAVTANRRLGETPKSRIEDAMNGIKEVLKIVLDMPATDEKNIVFQSAVNNVIAEKKKGKSLLILVVYDPLMKQVGDLAQQLYSESVQKFDQGLDFLSIVGSEKMHSIWNGAVEGTGARRDVVLFCFPAHAFSAIMSLFRSCARFPII